MDRHELIFDAGHLALDFLNTVALPDAGREDLLAAPATLLEWIEAAELASQADLAPVRASPPEARLLLADAERLRYAVAGIVESRVAGVQAPPLAVMEVNRVLGTRSAALRLLGEAGSYRLEGYTTRTRLLGLLAPVAEEAARLAVEADPTRLRRCAAEGCGLWFLDTSRNGRRRWCSMSRCGNRAKVAAHYRRRRAEEGSAPAPRPGATGGGTVA